MSEKPRVPGTPFKPGHPGGPGRPPLPVEVREAKKMSKAEVDAKLCAFLGYTKGELEAIMKSPNSTMLELTVGSILLHAVKHGDASRLNFILDRVYGKVKDRSEVELSARGEHRELIESVPRETLIALVKAKREA